MAKAESDGVIDIDGIPRRIKAGQEIPEGATVRQSDGPAQGRRAGQIVETRQPGADVSRSDEADQPKPDQRAKPGAPENREKQR